MVLALTIYISLRSMIDDRYSRISQQQLNNPAMKVLIAGYVSQGIMYGLIITYCILSPSLFSAIAQLFMLVSFALTVATPYYLSKKEGDNNLTLIVSYPVQRIIYVTFLVCQIAIFIYKVVSYATGHYSNYSHQQQQFFQIQGPLNVYLPIILWPFTAIATLIRTKTKTLHEFELNINKAITVPLFLALGVLILLIEIFSISVAGFLFFICLLTLFVQRKLQFTSYASWILIIILHMLSIGYLLVNFLTTTSYLLYLEGGNFYRFYGVDALNHFDRSNSAKGYYICLIILFLLICLLQRMFVYNKYWLIAVKDLGFDQLREEVVDPNTESLGSPKKVVLSQLQQFQLQKINVTKSQVNQQCIDFRKDHSNQVKTQVNNSMGMDTVFARQKTIKKSSSISTQKSKGKGEKVFDGILWAINGFVSFVTSAGFLLRVTEIISIVVIQRYNNIYSFVAVFWLAMVATFENVRVIFYLTSCLLLPVELANFVILYGYNATESPYHYLQNLENYGFQDMELYWLDIIIFNVYIFYIFTYLLAANHQSHQAPRARDSKPGYAVMFLALLCRYTYLIPLLAIFFLGFSVVNLMNLVFVILFLVFFSSGENVIIESNSRNGQIVSKLTTFSRKYWSIIVYYTLICIIIKYGYFLFFEGQSELALRPTGINNRYNWSFNFSLSHVCSSNTTPLFLIFVMAEIQIIIYRSPVYLNYSFSLLSKMDDSLASNQSSQLKRMLTKIGECILQFYYQSLYYITGIVILVCSSFSWDIASLLTIIITCYGLLRGFNKKILAIIVFLDLGFLILNYLALFFTYKVVYKTVGNHITTFVNQISLLLGLLLNQYTALGNAFALDIVIFYFAVQSYRLNKILSENRFDQQGELNPSSIDQKPDDSQSQQNNRIRQQSIFDQSTVIEVEHNQVQFTKIYNKGVILSTKKLYSTNLCKKYVWWNWLCWFLSMVVFDVVAVSVLIFCLSFRLSVTMLIYLCIYTVYYFCVFNEIGKKLDSIGYYDRIESEVTKFRNKQQILLERDHPQSMITGQQATDSLLNFIKYSRQAALNSRLKWKKIIWYLSAIVSIITLILTYSAQFIISQYYQKYINFSGTSVLIDILFIVGISVQNSLSYARQSYFYYLMVFVAIVQKLLLVYEEQMNNTEKIEKEISNNMELATYSVADPRQFINEHCGFIEAIDNQVELQIKYKQPNKMKTTLSNSQSSDNSKQANLLIYFNYKQTQISINLIYGLFVVLIRFYLVIMLINLYDKSNVFAFAYLLAVLYFWCQTTQFKIIKDINKAAIIILISQYLLLLLDLNNNNSPLPLPSTHNLSVLQTLINDPKWINYLLFNTQQSSIISSFMISAIVIFLTQLYFTIFYYLIGYINQLLTQIYARYHYIKQILEKMPVCDTVYLNYQNYKSWAYRIINISYELFLSNSYIFVSFVLLGLLSGTDNYLGIVLVVLVCVYLYLAIFTNFSGGDKFYARTSIFLKIIRTVLFLIILLAIVSYIPVFQQNNQYVRYFQELSTISQIFLLFFIQLWLDLHESSSFKSIIYGYLARVENREAVMIKCLAYQSNEDLIRRLSERYREIMRFQVNLQDALNIIDEWHKMMYKEKKMELEQIKSNLAQSSLTMFKEEIRDQLAANKDKEQGIGDRLRVYMDQHIDVAMKFRYYDIAKYVVWCNHRVIRAENHHIDIWDYVLEDYEVVNRKINEAEIELANITKSVEAQQLGERMNRLEHIKKSKYSDEDMNADQESVMDVRTPKKLFLDLSMGPQSWPKIFVDFFFSNFSYFLYFLIWVYYLINPCLLSLPLLIYIFSFEAISTRKPTHLLQIYIFLIIVLALCVQVTQQSSHPKWIKYLFFQTQTNSYNYCIRYLFFLSILIFINQQKIKYEGNKFTDLRQAECCLKGVLRILINSDYNSKTNLWKMKIDQQYQQKQCNPMDYFSHQIQTKPQPLIQQAVPSFFQEMIIGKTGIDFYPLIASVQILITIYLIFLYSFMVTSQSQSIENTIKYFQFSGDMVLAVLANVLVIVLQRYITLMEQQQRKIRIKYWFTMVILASFLIFIYYIAPTSTTIKDVYSPRPCLLIFSFIYFFYFFISCLQIRFGYKKFKSLNSIMTRRRNINNIILMGFINIPFLYELKTIMDWSFCASSLAIFDWFRLFSIYSSAFSAKMQYYGSTSAKLGDSNSTVAKLVGWISFIAILIIIFGPMILFSGLNPIAENNLVIAGSMSLGIQIANGNYFRLYSTSHFLFPAQSYNSSTFYSSPQNFSQVPTLQLLSSKDISNQFQLIQFQPFSDTNWGISNPNINNLVGKLQQTIRDINLGHKPVTEFQIVIKYQLIRSVAATTSKETKLIYKLSNISQLEDLNRTFTTCNQSTYLPNVYINLIRLDTIDTTYKPRVINFINSSGKNPYEQGISLTLLCGQSNSTFNTNDVFWAVNATNGSNDSAEESKYGIFFNVLCDKYQNLIGGLGFTALYTSVILVVARLIRSSFTSDLSGIPYYMNPKSDNILQISEAIGTLRSRKQFRQEYLMYYELIDIIRSPDMIKYISGSFPVLIEEANQQRTQKEQQKQMAHKKNKIE